MTATAPPRTAQQLPFAVPVCFVTAVAVAFGVLISPYGSLFMFDDSFGPGSAIAPVAAGVCAGLLQSLAYGPRAALLGALLAAAVGALAFPFVYPMVTCAAGCALGAGPGAIVRRLWGQPPARVSVLLLVAFTAVTVGFWLVR